MTKVIEKVQRLLANLRMKSKKNLTAMHMGEKRKLYMIHNQYLSSIMFQALLCRLKEEEKIEVGNKEPITLPYYTWLFESILQLEFGFRVYTLLVKLMLKHKSVQCTEKNLQWGNQEYS